jgi:putative FmdB family regulatory protein
MVFEAGRRIESCRSVSAMPIYEYRCRKCRHVFEALRPMDDDGSTLDCSECGARRPERIPSVFAAVTGKSAGSAHGGSGCGSCSRGSCKGCGSH